MWSDLLSAVTVLSQLPQVKALSSGDGSKLDPYSSGSKGSPLSVYHRLVTARRSSYPSADCSTLPSREGYQSPQ